MSSLIHGIFEQTPGNHLNGSGCNKCIKDSEKYTTDEFIVQAKQIHGDKYNYDKVNYINNKTKVIIVCNKHDEAYEFECQPSNFLQNHGCPKCADLTNAYTQHKFIELAKNKHGDKYDYSDVKYINSYTKVSIKCKEHGNFMQEPSTHYEGGGCRHCAINKLKYISTVRKPRVHVKNASESKLKYTKEDFINLANKIHKNKYNYSDVNYINSKTKVLINCTDHGQFAQLPSAHLGGGQGCMTCSRIKQTYTTDDFIKLAKKMHGDKYDYTDTIYVNSYTKVSVNCTKTNHGIFLQNPHNHMAGQGCPKCNESKGEQQIAKYLDDYKINFVRQKKYDECKNKICLPFDFYLTDFNILIEYDGIGHFSPIEAFGGVNAFEYRQRNDTIKNKFVQDNNIKLLRIKYNEKINKKLDELIDFIKNNIT